RGRGCLPRLPVSPCLLPLTHDPLCVGPHSTPRYGAVQGAAFPISAHATAACATLFHEKGGRMNALVLAAVQALLAGPSPDAELPRSFDPEWVEPRERQPIYPWIGIEPMAVWTAFDSDWGVKNVWGYGADATVTLDYGTQAFLGFRAGYLGWNTRVHTAGEGDLSCWIRQYRIGVFGQFPFRFLEVGIGANTGG